MTLPIKVALERALSGIASDPKRARRAHDRITRVAALGKLSPSTLAFQSSLGRCTLVYGHDGVREIRVGTKAPADKGPHPAEMRRLAADVAKAIDGKKVDFANVQLSMDGVPRFHADVYRALLKVRWGLTISYGELAAKAGRPGAARAVGQAMARSRWSIVMPCHRVVRSDGQIGGFGGPAGERLKRRLLDAEYEAGL